jgi:hypothetical protein
VSPPAGGLFYSGKKTTTKNDPVAVSDGLGEMSSAFSSGLWL